MKIQIIAVGGRANKLDKEENILHFAERKNIPFISHPDELPASDFLISVQYHNILEPKHISTAKKMAVNLHMAPLPEYRGCNAFSFAILDGKKEFGTTLHVLDQGIDSGDILFEERFPIPENIWVEELYKETLERSKHLFENKINRIFKGDYVRIDQKSLIQTRSQSFHLRKEIEEIKRIDENWPEDKKKRYIRATYFEGFERPYTVVNGRKKYYNREDA